MIEYQLYTEDDFMQAYQAYKNTVFGIALNYTKNKEDANDILQEVFTKFYLSDKTFNCEEHKKAWLIRVTVNACKKHLLSSWWKRTVPLDNTIPFENEADFALIEAVMSLPRSYRIVVHLYYYEGYKISEIADLLDDKESTIKVRLMRARKKLKHKLKEDWKDE